jgi:hypothetical protein
MSKMRRRLIRCALAVCLIALAIEGLLGLVRHRINRQDFARIVAGMNRQEVTALLGSPGDYRDPEYGQPWTCWSSTSWGDLAGEQAVWFGNVATIQVAFAANGTITGAAYYETDDWVRRQRLRYFAFEWWRNVLDYGTPFVQVRE